MDSIIIVEDSKSFGTVLKKNIEDSLAQEVVWVQNHGDALHLLANERQRFSLAILDLVLPDAPNGEIVDLFLEYDIPTIVLSGKYSNTLRDELFAKGILDYFIKDNIRVIETVIYFINRFYSNKLINVLVVDDSKSARFILSHFLEINGFTVFSVASGQEALEIMDQNEVLLVITDYQMPEMDGFELVRKIRARYSRYEVAIIGLSSQGDTEVEVQFIKAGANDYLPKPFQKETLSCRLSQTVEVIERYREQSELIRLHRSILYNALDAIITVDKAGIVMEYNPAAENLFGYLKKDIMGKDIADFIIPEHLKRQYGAAMFRHKTGAAPASHLQRRTEFPGVREDGKMVDLEISLTATPHKGNMQFTAFLQDITDRKQLLKSLEETLAVAESAGRAKSEFIANTSHEIRTPMNAILGFTELALKMDLSPKLRDYQEKVKNASHTLMGLLDDVLDFSKIEAGRLELDPVPFEINDLFDRLSDLFSIQTADKNIELILSIPASFNLTLIGDSQRLEQVLINLIRNAIKFTDQGSIIVNAEPKETKPGRLEIFFSVKDSGIGIDPDRLPMLFDPFVQADGSTTRKYGGTGLGLTICKRLVDLMHGEISAKSTPGEGSTFYFNVPFESRPGAEEVLDQVPEHMKGSRVLIVDDNKITRDILTNLVESFAMVPSSVESGEAALSEWMGNSANKQPFGLILMDWRMSGIDGITASKEILKAARSKGDGSDVLEPKIIMLTAFGDDATRQLALDSGVSAFMSKPITRSHLINAIRDVAGERPVGGDNYAKILAEELETTEKISGASILLVEDNPINQQVAQELLERVGLLVELANNGQQALDKLAEKSYDAILMDVQMPVMDGMEATKHIRRQPQHNNTPIIAMTAHAMAEDKRKCLQAGMDEHLTKPIRPERLYGVLAHWLGDVKPAKPLAIECSDTTELPEIAGLDIADGLERVVGNRRLYRKLLIRFREDNANDVEKVSNALSAGDYATAASLVHGIKGVSSNIGAKTLHLKAEVLEKTIKDHAEKMINEAFAAFSIAHSSLIAAMEVLAPSEELAVKKLVTTDATAEDDEDVEKEKVAALLEQLIELLQENSVETDTLLEGLSQELITSKAVYNMNKMLAKLEQYQFDEAIDQANEIANVLNISLQTKEQ
ncbi:MAG: response regulator [Magnetococcales bacterium]|nr:response regulator [Magnetococcales bacterium]